MDRARESPSSSAPGSSGDPHTATFREGLPGLQPGPRAEAWLGGRKRGCLCASPPPLPPGALLSSPRSSQSQHFDGLVVEVWNQLLIQKHA